MVAVSVAAHDLLGDPAFGGLGLHCVTADPHGYDEAADLCDLFDATSDDLPLVLGHDLSAHHAQTLSSTMQRCGKVARVLLTALCILGPADADDAATLAAHAVRQWGTRKPLAT